MNSANSAPRECIEIRGAAQNNLRHLDLFLPLQALTVVTGVSGSGKSSLAFQTLYAEGQRRYVETFSSYARQFLRRMARPDVLSIRNLPPALAIRQGGVVRSSRSTVGSLTDVAELLRQLFVHVATLSCQSCGRPVVEEDPASVAARLESTLTGQNLLIGFPVTVPEGLDSQARASLRQLGYRRVLDGTKAVKLEEAPPLSGRVLVVQDRLALSPAKHSRLLEALEQAFRHGRGQLAVVDENGIEHPFSAGLHCAHCDRHYDPLRARQLSSSSPLGACPECRGFGRTIGIDLDLVIPDAGLSLREGAIRPWRSESFSDWQNELEAFCREQDVPLDTPWRELSDPQRRKVHRGDRKTFWGIDGYFEMLESRSYKMHVRVLLSRYRTYNLCTVCSGTRLQSEALLWRAGGRTIADVFDLPMTQLQELLAELGASVSAADRATIRLFEDVQARTRLLCDVGLEYLSLSREAKTLSGGELQRVHLTSALGSQLSGALYVLDEPSIGLHPRDLSHLARVLQRLRDAGNTLVVVEHDPQLVVAADHLVDLGPGPGERGGHIVHSGPLEELTPERSPTAAWLAAGLGRPKDGPVGSTGPAARRRAARAAASEGSGQPATSGVLLSEGRAPDLEKKLTIRGAREHNLKDLTVEIPLQRLVAVSGVSGSGKSSLVRDVLYKNALRRQGDPVSEPGEVDGIDGLELCGAVELLDQTPVKKSPRSIPATATKAFDPIRKLFAEQTTARRLKLKTSHFSFNSKSGRCKTCAGSGYLREEMQFLSDVFLPCPDCEGRRFVDRVLSVTYRGRNLAQVLELSAQEAMEFFAEHGPIVRRLAPLRDVGLGYLRLGQPVSELSGGEAQRLRLASVLAEKRKSGRLILMDEPTTGLHPADTEQLLQALRRLVDRGHSVVIIEHNLQVLSQMDWILDLGPEGGAAGGELVAAGPPAVIAECEDSRTGQALLAVANGGWDALLPAEGSIRQQPSLPPQAIRIEGAREHNLKNLSVEIPLGQLVVVTGVSGSGKSTLAFDVLFAEGQRRYLDTVNTFARTFLEQMPRPEVDRVVALPPTVAIEQRTSRGGQRSTVGTITEIDPFLRLLFTKAGVQHCDRCGERVGEASAARLATRVVRDFGKKPVRLLAPLIVARKGFHREEVDAAQKRGRTELRVDGRFLPIEEFRTLDRFKEHTVEATVAKLDLGRTKRKELAAALERTMDEGGGLAVVVTEEGEESRYHRERTCPSCGRGFPVPDSRFFSSNSRHGWCVACKGLGVEVQTGGGRKRRRGRRRRGSTPVEETPKVRQGARPCPECQGARLQPQSLAVELDGRSIADVTALPIAELAAALERIEAQLDEEKARLARDILSELRSRAGFVESVGLGYLSLDRAAQTLSGGEAQRARLAAQLGANLRGVCYVLDEPTIGLHARDNERLLALLEKLRDRGNTVVVVEHDDETIRRADHVIDLGPAAGRDGGMLVVQGDLETVLQSEESLTAKFLRDGATLPSNGSRPLEDLSWLRLRGASLHNLRGVDLSLPLGRLSTVTGVSGSGKSSLVRGVLLPALTRHTGQAGEAGAGAFAELVVEAPLERVLEVDQSPIGRTPRSVPATYVKILGALRSFFSRLPEARMRGFGPSRFSFNTEEGRCPECGGLGQKKVEMSFLPTALVPCERCDGQRFSPATLEIQYKGLSIADVLSLTVSEARELLARHPKIARTLALLEDTGLGYLSLGQPSPTLSGGEAQRLKLVAELSRRSDKPTLYILEEPTIGLHMSDVQKLLDVLHRLVDRGDTVVVIEHNLELIAASDYVVDLGPEGGLGGGKVIATGTPRELAGEPDLSHTGRAIRPFFDERR